MGVERDKKFKINFWAKWAQDTFARATIAYLVYKQTSYVANLARRRWGFFLKIVVNKYERAKSLYTRI